MEIVKNQSSWRDRAYGVVTSIFPIHNMATLKLYNDQIAFAYDQRNAMVGDVYSCDFSTNPEGEIIATDLVLVQRECVIRNLDERVDQLVCRVALLEAKLGIPDGVA